MLKKISRLMAMALLGLWGGWSCLVAPALSQNAGNPPGEELALTGKLVSSAKRGVWAGFPGSVVEIKVQTGQKVGAGEALLRYRLQSDVVLQLNRRLSSPQIRDLTVRLADADKNLASLRERLRGLKDLARQRLTSEQSVVQAERELQYVIKYRDTLAENLRQEERFAKEDRAIMEQQLGQRLTSNEVPQEMTLNSPLDGYILWIHPDLRVGYELRPNDPVMLVGVINPMILRARVYETEALQLKMGDEAEVEVESIPDRVFTAKVSQIPWSTTMLALEQPSYYEVEFKVPNPDLVLREGLKAKVTLKKNK